MVAQEVVPHKSGLPSFAPRDLGELMEYCKLVAGSAFVPQDYRGKPADILVAIQWGAELGLAPLSALQGISVINGRPAVWGDTALALVNASGLLEEHVEDIAGEGDQRYGFCNVKRKGRSIPCKKTFSVDDAKRAKLWLKAGPWTQYPDRMLTMRARGFALRDTFPDILRGVITREEAQDIPTEPLPKAESDLPWAKRLSERVSAAGPSQEAAAEEGAVPESSVPTLELASPPSASEESEVGTAPSLFPEPIPDEPILINQEDRRRLFGIARANGHDEEEVRRYLLNVYGITSTAEVQVDWLDAIYARLRQHEKLFS